MGLKFESSIKAILFGDLRRVRRLIRTIEAANVVDFFNGFETTPLYAASQVGATEIVSYLLEKGANVNRKSEITGATALRVAAYGGHVDVVALLLRHDADADLADNDNVTSLLVAAQEGRVAAVRRLCEAGASVNKTSNDGASPLYVACQKGRYHCAQILIKYGANVNQTAHGLSEATPLIVASTNGQLALVRLLLKHDADPFRVNLKGRDALDVVCSDNDADRRHTPAICSYLVAARQRPAPSTRKTCILWFRF